MIIPLVLHGKRPLARAVALFLFCLPLHASVADYYMTLRGAGEKSGSDWANAMDASAIQTTLNSLLQPGDTLYLGGPASATEETYGDKRFILSTSGTAGSPKRLIGVDRGHGFPRFIGDQKTRSYTTITLADTVSYWTIKNLHIERRDMGVATSGGSHLGLVFEGITVRDIKSRGFSFADCDDLLLVNCRAERYNELGFTFLNSCDGVVLRDCVADCTGTGATADPDWKDSCSDPVGFNFHIKNSTAPPNTDILLENCEALNNDENTADTADYEQGDGFKTEGSNRRVTFIRCKSHLNQDSAYDLKGSDQLIQDCVAVNNSRYGFKVWYEGDFVNCVSVNNGARQLTVAATSTGNTIHVDHSTFHSASTSQAGAVIETAGNTVVMTDSLLTFAGSAGTYTAGGTFSLARTSKHANASNTANSPAYKNPVLPWNGEGDDFDNQVFGPTRGYNSQGRGGGPATLILDDADVTGVTIAGAWTATAFTSGYFGAGYIQDGNIAKGGKSVRFTPAIPQAGLYAVYAWWTSGTNRANNAPISIAHASGTADVSVDQTVNGGKWVLLGTYSFNSGTTGSITVSNTGTSGYVVADAVKLVALAGGASDYAAFRAECFSSTELLDASVSGDSADPDADSLPNLLEYAFNLDPRVANPSPLSVFAADGRLLISYPRRTDNAGLRYVVEVSSDLSAWSSGAGATTEIAIASIGPNLELVTERDQTPPSSAPARFVRLRVELH